jgi:hypothetical protein
MEKVWLVNKSSGPTLSTIGATSVTMCVCKSKEAAEKWKHEFDLRMGWNMSLAYIKECSVLTAEDVDLLILKNGKPI